MAPVGEQMDRNNGYGNESDKKEEGNLWANILSEVQQSSSTKLPACKKLLVLGDNESGKTTLIAKLQGNEDPRKGSGLEYTFIDVKDEYRDDNTRLGAWIVDGELQHRGLLKFALSGESFEDTLVVLVASMHAPWDMLESLQRWVGVLSTHLDRLKIPAEKRRQAEEALVQQFQEYVEPEEGVPQTTRRATKSDEEKVLLPLGETTLTNNLGIPIVVVLTKCDSISTLEKEHEYREEHFDFIQQHIRKFCLNYGAALFYTSVKEEKNCDLLYKYLVHRIYNLPFSHPAFVVERDAVFVPFGWDNEKKISILYESMTSMKPEDVFDEVIAKPVTRKPIQREVEVTAEDEQVFLMKQQTQLAKTPTPRQGESPLRPSSGGVQKPTTSPRVGGTPNVPTPVKKTLPPPSPHIEIKSPWTLPVRPTPRACWLISSPRCSTRSQERPLYRDQQEAQPQGEGEDRQLDSSKPGAQSNEGVLANFFNSLLSKKTGAAGSPGATPPATPGQPQTKTPDRAAVNRDAAAELDRMTRTKKSPLNQSNSTAT